MRRALVVEYWPPPPVHHVDLILWHRRILVVYFDLHVIIQVEPWALVRGHEALGGFVVRHVTHPMFDDVCTKELFFQRDAQTDSLVDDKQ